MAMQTQPQETQNGALLEVRDLRQWFELRKFVFARAGYVKAVDGVSFKLPRGEALALVGESGSGKTTLARTVLGLYKPTSGEVIFEGKHLSSLNRHQMQEYRSDIGYIQQDPYGALPPFMSIRSILAEPMKIHGIRDKGEQHKRICDVMEEVRLTPVEDFIAKFPHMLSGGQQQRVVIARGMILNPKLIAADEPVSMLDASVRVEVLKLLRRIQEMHNLGVIYITHDLSTVRYFAERIFIMYAAKTVEKAPVESLLEHHFHPYTVALLAAIPDPDPENAKRFRDVPAGEPPNLVRPPSGCRFHPRCAQAIEGLCEVEEPPEFYPLEGVEHSVECWLYKK
jgi:peptide/nickel transport system ATP-binding protein